MPAAVAIGVGVAASTAASCIGTGLLASSITGGLASSAVSTLMRGGNRHDYLRNMLTGGMTAGLANSMWSSVVSKAGSAAGDVLNHFGIELGAETLKMAGTQMVSSLAVDVASGVADLRYAQRKIKEAADAQRRAIEENVKNQKELTDQYRRKLEQDQAALEASREYERVRIVTETRRRAKVRDMFASLDKWRSGLIAELGDVFA